MTSDIVAGELARPRMGERSMRFQPEWEARFDAATAEQRVRHFIRSAFVALLIYNLFTLSDWFVLPDLRDTSWLIRLVLVSPVELAALYLFYRHKAWFVRQPVWQAEGFIMVTGVVAAGSLAWIIGLSESEWRTLAHAGFAPMLVYGNLVQRLRFRSALLNSVLILVIHGGLLAATDWAPSHATIPVLLLNLLTAMLTLVSSYEMEREERQRFILRDAEGQLIETLDQANRQLDTLSRHDALTGCANRRQAHDYLREQVLSRAQAVSLILLDVDHFKAYNDLHGHPAGDRCLKAVADALAQLVPREDGLVARWGGEEFLVILPGGSLSQALGVAHAIREGVVALNLPHQGSPTAPMVTVSLGVAHASRTDQGERGLDGLQEAADQALYLAKRAGRDAVRVAPSSCGD